MPSTETFVGLDVGGTFLKGARLSENGQVLARLHEPIRKESTQALLSQLEDADYNEAITRFQSLQTALQANLQTTGRLLSQTLLDFLQ